MKFLFNRITWIDNGGDRVTILSDEELIIALTEMKGPVYKLSVDVLSEKEEEGKEKASGTAEGNSEAVENAGIKEKVKVIGAF
jgi:hypothetical protein